MRRVTPLALLLVASALAIVVPPAEPVVTGGPIVAGDLAWMMTAAGLVLLMTPGLSFFYGGMVQKKNVISTMLQSLMAMIVISIVWVVVGFSLAFGDDIGGVIGNPSTFFMFRHVGTATHPDAGTDDSARHLRAVPSEVRDHHAGADHRIVRRARAVLGGRDVHRALQPDHLLPAGARDVASAGFSPPVGRARLRGRHGGPYLGRAWRRWPAPSCSAGGSCWRRAASTCRRTSRS